MPFEVGENTVANSKATVTDNKFKIIIKEPLLYFLLLGTVMFVLYQQVSTDGYDNNSPSQEIVVTKGQIDALSSRFEKVWRRPPDQTELENLIQSFIREEVLYREALAMGLDRDDPVVRRRMNQKIEFITEDIAGFEQPADEELQIYYQDNIENYLRPPSYSFSHVFLSPDKRGTAINADAAKLLDILNYPGADAELLGDSIMIPHQFNNISQVEIEKILGQKFAQELEQTTIGQWYGPVESAFGIHLVNISERKRSKIPQLDEVRDEVLRDWSFIRREQANTAFYSALRERYKVKIEDANQS